MNIIRLNGAIGEAITVDSTLITVDSTEITVDQANTSTPNTYQITLLPSKFFEDMILELKNELTEDKVEVEATAVQSRGYTTITFYLENIAEGSSFEGKLYNEDKTEEIYRGKFFATSQTDLQEYEMTPKTNNKYRM